MNYKKTEDNARLGQTRQQQMIQKEIIISENQKAKFKQEDDTLELKDAQKQGVLLQNLQVCSAEIKNIDSDVKIINRQDNQIQNNEGLLKKKQGENKQQKLQNDAEKKEQKQKKYSTINLLQNQYSKIQNPIVADIISDKKDSTNYLVQIVFILAFFIEQIATEEYHQLYEYLIISAFFLLCIINYLLIKYQEFRYLHLVQIANSIMVTVIVGLWVYNNQHNQKDDVQRYTQRIIKSGTSVGNQDANNSSNSQVQNNCSIDNSLENDIYKLLLLSQSKFFFQGAILYHLQDCLNKHLIPKYRQFISIITSLSIAVLFYVIQIFQDHNSDFDLAIKCLFLISLIILIEKFQMRNLSSYLISFQALKKYFTLSLCNRSCYGNNIQIEINPKDLTSCKVIYGNQQLSSDLLSDSMSFFRNFQLDPFSLTNYNKIEQIDQGEEKAVSQEADINNFDFGASTEKLKIKNFDKIQKILSAKLHTASKQFIEQKILKFSSSELNRKRSLKHSNPTIVSLKRIGQDDKTAVKEGEQPMTIGLMNTNININKTDNLIPTFRNTNNKNNTFQDYSEQQNNGGVANQNDKDQLNIIPSLIKVQKNSFKSDEINTQSPAPKQGSEKAEKQAYISDDKKDTNNQDTYSLKTNEQSRVLPSSLANRYHTLEDIIKDPNLRSIQLQGKFKKSEGQKTQYLSITLIKYHNIFQNEIIIATITDITSIQEINNLQKEVQFKEIMFANVTHDLRTPLYAIKYSIDKLKEIFQIHQCNNILEQKEQIQQKIKDLQHSEVNDLHEQINISVANTHLMEAIIQDIIDNNRNRMGKLETDIRQFNLMELLLEMEKLMEIILWEKRKKIKLKFQICNSIKQNSLIYSDSQRLKQVLMNLISNSIKFTKKGGILIKVTRVFPKESKNVEKYLNSPYKTNLKQKIAEIVEQNEPSQNQINTSLADKMKVLNENQLFACYQENVFSLGLIKFQIIDTGIGMNDKVLKSLFTPYNTHNNENMNRHGIGLGLTICKTIVEKLGPFQLKVASKEKRGSKFTFYIYHDLHQSMAPSKLDQIIPQEQKRQIENTTVNNNGYNYNQKRTMNQNEDEIQQPMASPNSFVNLIPNNISEQNLKSEIYLEFDIKEKASKQDSINKRKELDYYKSGNNQSILPESDKQSSTYQQDSRRKINSVFQRGITNGSIFQTYQQNYVQKTDTEKSNEIEEKDEIKSMSQKDYIQQSIENGENNNHHHNYFDAQEKNKSHHIDVSQIHNNTNNFESFQFMAKSPKFVSFNNTQSQHFHSASNNTNIIQNKIYDSINQIKDTEPNQKSNILQKFSFGGNSSTVKKYQIQSIDNTASKNNTSGVFQEKDAFETSGKLQKVETELKVNLAHSSEEIQDKQEKQFSDFNLKQDENLLENINNINHNSAQQVFNSSLNSTIASIVIGQKTANEKKENENEGTLNPFSIPFITQKQNSEFTASRHVIHNQIHKQCQVTQQQLILQKVQQPVLIQTEESSQQRRNSNTSSPRIKFAQNNTKKQLQDQKNKSMDIKSLKQYDFLDQNYMNQKPFLFKNQENQENAFGHESSIYLNNIVGVGGFPSFIVQTQSRVTQQKSSKIIKNQSYNIIEQAKYDEYIDEQQLDEDQMFNTSILQSLEDTQEHANLEESSPPTMIKSHQFQVMKNKKQTNQQDVVSNLNYKSDRESQLISNDKKGLYISKIDRYNHVTNHKMTESVQLNYIKKIKFGVAESDEQQEKQYLNMLICDDSVFNIKILQRLLLNIKKYKMSIDTCLSGEEAIEKFLEKNKPNSQEPYHYIFLDWNMPIMDGYETSSKIKFYVKDESYLDCPIIICTAYEDTTEINKCLRNGTDGILTKPISQEQINELLSDFQLSKENFSKNKSN